MVNIKFRLCIIIVCLISCISSTVKYVTFENVTVSLIQIFSKKEVYISSGDKLSEFIGNETFMKLRIYEENIPLLTENSVANLPDVEFIYMHKCGIEDIEPGAFNNLPKLFDLSLTDNKIKTIRDGVFTNLNAFALGLSLNKLSTWNGEWVKGSRLQDIDLSYNQIEEIPENALAYLKPRHSDSIPLAIASFDVSNNEVKKIHPKAFNGVHTIAILSLSSNKLSEIPVEMFANTKRFYNVHLDFNRLSCFPLEVVNVTRVNKVSLKNNPLTCDCVENWLANEREARKLFTDGDVDTFKKNCSTSL